MIHRLAFAFVLCAPAVLQTAGAQEAPGPAVKPGSGPAARAPRQAGPATPSETPDFKVVFWFGRTDWKHQVYDVRKGQYTRAVEDWVNHVEVDRSGYVMPGRMATVRDVYLKNEKGRTEQEKLESAIQRFQAGILGIGKETSQAGRSHRAFLEPNRFAETVVRSPRRDRLGIGRPPGMTAPTVAAPAPSGFPMPYPYPRPHP